MARRHDIAVILIWAAIWAMALYGSTARGQDQWAVSQYRTLEDRPLYECDLDCIADQVRGSKIGRVLNQTLCEGQLDPAWTSSGGRQWQYVTNTAGLRGVAVCSLQSVVEPPPSDCEAGEVALCVAACGLTDSPSDLPLSDPACTECQYEAGLWSSSPQCVAPPALCGFSGAPIDMLADDPTCTECQFVPGLWSGDVLCIDTGGVVTVSGVTFSTFDPATSYPGVPALYDCALGENLYFDRSYNWTRLDPPFDTYQCLRNQNNDKNNSDPDYMVFDIDQPATVYVHLDRNNTRDFLADWTLVGTPVEQSQGKGGTTYSKAFAAGTVTLPGNAIGFSTYTVIIGAPAVPPPPPPPTGAATLQWTPPTTNEDGSELTDLAGYRIYWDQNESLDCLDMANEYVINDKDAATADLADLPVGLTYFGATAFDTSANESACSNIVSKTIVP